jgi:hypothetical protein
MSCVERYALNDPAATSDDSPSVAMCNGVLPRFKSVRNCRAARYLALICEIFGTAIIVASRNKIAHYEMGDQP